MSIAMSARCILCHVKKNIETALSLGDEATAAAFAKELLEIHRTAPEGASSPYLGPPTNALYQKYYHLGMDRYKQEKEDSNRFVLERMDALRVRVETQPDPVYAGLQFSILGNYLDFSALYNQVSFTKLDEMMEQALEMALDMDCYQQMCEDMRSGKKLLYITDNAGEIGFDRIFAEQIHKAYPHLEIVFMVRGQVAQNDATREDAELIGIPFPVIDNGNAVAGTEISLLGAEAKQALEEADVVIAKGMGNTETMFGCGYNVYYAFLIKCIRFEEFFKKPMMTPVLIKDHP